MENKFELTREENVFVSKKILLITFERVPILRKLP